MIPVDRSGSAAGDSPDRTATEHGWRRVDGVLALVGAAIGGATSMVRGGTAVGGAALVLTVALGAALAAGASHDQRTFRIPDRLTIPLTAVTVVALVGLASTGHDRSAIAGSAGATTAALFLWCIHLLTRGGIGRGDAKLAPALGCFVGLHTDSIYSAVFSTLTSLGLACAIGVAVGFVANPLRGRSLRAPFPFGPPLVIAAFVTAITIRP